MIQSKPLFYFGTIPELLFFESKFTVTVRRKTSFHFYHAEAVSVVPSQYFYQGNPLLLIIAYLSLRNIW